MTYDEAKAIVKEYAPELLLDAERKTLPHICVRRTLKGAPFSIMLPQPMAGEDPDPEAEKKTLTDALDAARAAL